MPEAGRQPERPTRRRTPAQPPEETHKAWITVGANLQIAPYNSVQYSFGFTRTMPDDRPVTIKRTERTMYEIAEALVDRHVRKMVRLAQQVRREHGLDND